MWESLLHAGWRSLVVVPADHGTPVEVVTNALHAVSRRPGGEALKVVDASSATVAQGEGLAMQLKTLVDGGARVVAIVDSVMLSLAGIPLIRSAEEVLLVVRVGDGDPDGMTSTIGIVGPERIIGTVAVPPQT